MLMHPLYSWVISIVQTLIGQIYNLLLIMIAALLVSVRLLNSIVSINWYLSTLDSNPVAKIHYLIWSWSFYIMRRCHLWSFSVSDHCSLKFNVITPVQSAGLPAHDLWDFNTADLSSITSDLNSCDWSTVFKDCVTASQFADAFYAELNTVVNMFVPLKILRSTKTNKKFSYPLYIFVSSIEPSLLLGGAINVSKHSYYTRNISV